MFKKILIGVITIAALFACGYKGPLYLPKDAGSQPNNNSKNQFAPTSNVGESMTSESTPRKSLLPAKLNESSTTESSVNANISNS